MKKVKRKIIKINEELCDGCGNCIVNCPEQAIQIVDTPKGPRAKLVKEFYCDGLGACLGSCPTGALVITESDAEPYNEEATIARIKEVAPEMLKTHLNHMKEHAAELPEHHSHQMHGMSGCPGSRAMAWGEKMSAPEKEPAPKDAHKTQKTELRQWPVQLTLVSPSAPYFRDADLLIAADCVPFAFADFHSEFLKNKSLVIGCPKLDDIEFYREKLTELFKEAEIKSVTVVNMEVPCCFGLQQVVKEAIKASGKRIPYCETVIGIKGNIL